MDTYIAKSTPTAKSLTGRAAALIAAMSLIDLISR